MSEEKPIHEHDCDHCKFLGTFNGQDLYYHPPVDKELKYWTLVSRYGKHGDYQSASHQTKMPQLIEAHKRAVAAGYLKEGEYS